MKKQPQERRDVKAIVAALDVADTKRVANPGHFNVGDKVVRRGEIFTVVKITDSKTGRITCKSDRWNRQGNYNPDNLTLATPLDIKRARDRVNTARYAAKKRLERAQAAQPNMTKLLNEPSVFDAKSDSTAPDHYKMAISPLEFIVKNQLGFCEGNAIKYLCRWRSKGGLEDLKKARTYIERLIKDNEP